MLTMISLLKRRDDASLAEFLGWYEKHADAAVGIPGLRRYVVSTAADDGQAFDAVSALTFDDSASLNRAMNSAEGERSRADTREHVSARTVLHVVQNELVVPKG